MSVRFAYSIQYVQDVAKTLDFYSSVFGFEQKLLTPEGDYGELNTGSTTLSFADMELGRSNFQEGFEAGRPDNLPFGVEWAFTTENVADLIEKAIAHGATILTRAIVKPWGQTVGYVRDPNGFILEICTPISPSEQS